MKILHCVESYFPSVGGMQEVVKQLSEELVRLGHEVTVMTSFHPERKESLIEGVRIVAFKLSGNLAKGITGGEQEACLAFLRQNSFDIIVNFAAQQWATDIMIDKLQDLPGKKIFVPTGFSGLHDPLYRDYFEKMKTWFHDYDASVFLSEIYQDAIFAKELGVKNRKLIPNGASLKEFAKQDQYEKKSSPRLVLLVGNHTGQKGHAEAMRIFSRLKSEDLELLIVGAKNYWGRCYLTCQLRAFLYNLFFQLKGSNKKISLCSLSRKETVEAYAKASVFFFPSRIECSPIVLFEAAASQTPFVSSRAGNAEEIALWTGAGKTFELHNEKSACDLLDECLQNEEESRAMGKRGRANWKEKFTWEAIAKAYEKLYNEVLKEGKG